ncbi:ASCH domain-containing protein [Nostocaceae cyanobacterium CENA357]|uniref:ASCH domain-containing protein n=1 Tax=Atlanticothrix silvestris CENA357 TaxID=1725252 RepID=A0A8J7HDF1_9CYAN|nr:ASCH domain-containing protein [Atlanticothrix silvestris]MBH8550990.1 ASCH domain-containing protein [Atlanticothrix silvestris CENA357]
MNIEINYPPKLKAISIHAPFAYAICMGEKKAEYRSQSTHRRGWVLIHPSQSKQNDDYFADYGIDPTTVKRGAIVGAVKITSCVGSPGNYVYHLVNPIKFNRPVEGVKGKQAIFWRAKTDAEKVAFTLASEQIREYLLNTTFH